MDDLKFTIFEIGMSNQFLSSKHDDRPFKIKLNFETVTYSTHKMQMCLEQGRMRENGS